MPDDNAARVADEVCALRAIFGDENVSFSRPSLTAPAALAIVLPDGLGTLSMTLPTLYPSSARPLPPTLGAPGLPAARAAEIVREAMTNIDDQIGEVCVFETASVIQHALQALRDSDAPTPAETAPAEAKAVEIDVLHGEPVTDRKSVFQAHVARITCAEDVDIVLRTLHRTSRKVATATHNILAYVVHSTHGVIHDCDDDGESGAGKGLLFTLQQTGVVNCVVVVSRWFGGVKLGPVRFKHINNCARNTLATWEAMNAEKGVLASKHR